MNLVPPGPLRVSAPALLLLVLGAMVYLTDRRGSAGGVLLGSLPSFVHAYAFSRLTMVVLARSCREAAAVALAWWALDALLELAQLPAAQAALPAWVRGSFDPLDLVALTLGALLAWQGFSTTRSAQEAT